MNSILRGTHPVEGTHFRVRIEQPPPFRTRRLAGSPQPDLAWPNRGAEYVVIVPPLNCAKQRIEHAHRRNFERDPPLQATFVMARWCKTHHEGGGKVPLR